MQVMQLLSTSEDTSKFTKQVLHRNLTDFHNIIINLLNKYIYAMICHTNYKHIHKNHWITISEPKFRARNQTLSQLTLRVTLIYKLIIAIKQTWLPKYKKKHDHRSKLTHFSGEIDNNRDLIPTLIRHNINHSNKFRNININRFFFSQTKMKKCITYFAFA